MNWQHLATAVAVLPAILASACASEQTVASPEVPRRSAAEAAPASGPASPDEPGPVIEAVPAAAPAASDTAAPVAARTESEIVCRYERRTGTNRKIRICRRPQTALDEALTRQTFDSLRRSQMGEPR